MRALTRIRAMARRAEPALNPLLRFASAVYWPAAAIVILWLSDTVPAIVDLAHDAAHWPRRTQSALVLIVLTIWAIRWGFRRVRRARADMAPAARPEGAARLATPPKTVPPEFHRAWRWVSNRYGADYAAWVLANADIGQSTEEVMDEADRLWKQWNAPTAPARLLSQTARHEAAHAVVSAAMGDTVLEVTIEPVGGFAGRCVSAAPVPRRAPQDAFWGHLVMVLAGRALDHADGVRDTGSCDDVDKAARFASSIISIGLRPHGYEGPLAHEALTDAAQAQATRILADHADAVAGIAEILLREKTVGNQAIRHLLPACETTAVASAHMAPENL